MASPCSRPHSRDRLSGMRTIPPHQDHAIGARVGRSCRPAVDNLPGPRGDRDANQSPKRQQNHDCPSGECQMPPAETPGPVERESSLVLTERCRRGFGGDDACVRGIAGATSFSELTNALGDTERPSHGGATGPRIRLRRWCPLLRGRSRKRIRSASARTPAIGPMTTQPGPAARRKGS
jgi:hypothetical protein